uniref:Reverse transcriptase domain-containing protein n=1 Tax=Tanacetum cinerariifolium TaxID=118510 RepID=A0A6L2KKP2_TANCI|nr:reverse transcriptase domain-containing protein [Tanacetum cinerariifolium]
MIYIRELMKMAPDSMEKMNHEGLRRAAEQLKYTRPDEMAKIGAKMANATPDELASMRSQLDAHIKYHLNAAQMLKQKAKNNLKGISACKARTLLLACSLNLMSCYLRTNQFDECIQEVTEKSKRKLTPSAYDKGTFTCMTQSSNLIIGIDFTKSNEWNGSLASSLVGAIRGTLIPKITPRRASVMENTTPLVTTVTKPTINPGDADTIPRVNIQEFCEEYYEDILPIIMEKVRHDRRKDVHTKLDFGEGPRERIREDSYHSSARARATKSERVKVQDHLRYGDRHETDSGDLPRGRSHARGLNTSREDHPKDKERFRSVGESYDDSFSHSYRDRNRSRHMKRRRDNESPLSSRSKSDSSDARAWFDELPPESIDSYKDLKAAFLAYFMQQKKYVKDPVEIHNIKQRDGETIEDFMERFQVETGRMKGAPECMRIFGFMHGVNNPELTKRLNERVPKTMEEMMITTTAFIQGEAVAASKKKGHASWKAQDQSKRQNSDKSGSSMEILYEHCFNRLWPEINSQMVLATTSLTGFSGETIWPLRQLRLLVIIGDTNPSTRAWMNFMIVKSLSPYNVEWGIVTIRSTILIPTECTSVITSSATSSKERTSPANFKVALHPDFPDQEVAIGGTLSDKRRVPRSVVQHRLNIREGYSPARQKKRGQAPERAKAIQAEDCYPLPGIDWKVESLCGYPFRCFLDAYKGYHQIQLAEPDEEKTTFHTGQGSQTGRNIKVYVDDLVVKSYIEAEMMRDIEETFSTLRKINMKLNLKKCSFGLAEGIFLGYVVTPEGIKPYGSSCVDGSGAGLILTNPKGVEFTYALRFKFVASNNEAEYEALIAGLWIAARMGVKDVNVSVDSKLVANQVLGTYVAKEDNMVLVKVLKDKSKKEKEMEMVIEEDGPTWMTQLVDYLKEETLPGDKKEARKLRLKARQYELIEGVLYRRSFLTPWLRCVGPLHVEYVMMEVHEGSCNMHAGPRSVVDKAIRLAYYWLIMHRDARDMIRRCNDFIPTEIGMPTYRTAAVDVVSNDEELVRHVTFKPGDFVYRSNDASHALAGRKLGPKWEGPYEVTEALGNGAYKLRSMDEIILSRTWNIANLKRCYL